MSAVERIRHELREIGLVTLYFMACFLFFLTLKKLLLDEYDIEVTVLGTAVVGALVVAKVVVLLGKTPLGRTGSGRLAVRVLWRTLVYLGAVFAVTLAERLFDLYRDSGDPSEAVVRLWAGKDVHHFLALNLAVGLSLIVFNVFHEIGRHLGHDTLRELFFGRRRDDARAPREEATG